MLDIKTKPAKEVFASAKLLTHNGAKVFFEADIVANLVRVTVGKTVDDRKYVWDAEALRQLSQACDEVAVVLNSQ